MESKKAYKPRPGTRIEKCPKCGGAVRATSTGKQTVLVCIVPGCGARVCKTRI